jgi:hypothetical protein
MLRTYDTPCSKANDNNQTKETLVTDLDKQQQQSKANNTNQAKHQQQPRKANHSNQAKQTTPTKLSK